jgi:hypothetical protein
MFLKIFRIWAFHSGDYEEYDCLLLVSCLGFSSTMKMKAVPSSETSINFSEVHGFTTYMIILFILQLLWNSFGFGKYLTKSRQNCGNACYHSVEDIVFSSAI